MSLKVSAIFFRSTYARSYLRRILFQVSYDITMITTSIAEATVTEWTWTTGVPGFKPNQTNSTEPFGLQPGRNNEDRERQFDLRMPPTLTYTYVAPVLIFVGLFSNTLSVAVLRSKSFRKVPVSFVLGALALVDIGVLLTSLLRHWIRAVTDDSLDIRSLTLAGCQLHFLFSYMLRQLSSWTLVLVTLERLICIVAPLRARDYCNRKRMVAAWIVIVLCLFAINSHTFRTLGILRARIPNSIKTIRVCFYTSGYRHFGSKVWPWIDIMLMSLVPFVLIFAFNMIIIVQMIRARKKRMEQMRVKGHGDAASSLTSMLIAASLVFLLTTAPVGIYFLGAGLWPDDTPREQYRRSTANAVINILYYLNSVLNFFMYCVSGGHFRRALVSVVCCRETRAEKATATGPRLPRQTMASRTVSTAADLGRDGEGDSSTQMTSNL